MKYLLSNTSNINTCIHCNSIAHHRPSTSAHGRRRDALIPDEKTHMEMRMAIENAELAGSSGMKMKKRSASARPTSRRMRERMRLEKQPVWPSEASQPCSPTRQILKIKAQRTRRELQREVSNDDWERYER